MCYSKDKTPYKTNLALWFPTELKGGKFEKPGDYFHVDTEKLMLGVGIHTFTKSLLKSYRDAVVDPVLGLELAVILSKLGDGGSNLGPKTYKRVPRGYDPVHQYKELLLFSGLTAGKEFEIPSEFYSPKLVDFCMGFYKDLAPVVSWVSEMKEMAGL